MFYSDGGGVLSPGWVETMPKVSSSSYLVSIQMKLQTIPKLYFQVNHEKGIEEKEN